MGFWSELEGNLEKYIEGFFKDKFKGVLQPVDVAKGLAREMRDRVRSGLQEIYVPNRYEIYLGPEDMAAFQYFMDRLGLEMTEYISARAAEKEYTLLGPVRVNFQEHPELHTGQLKIESFFDETITGEGPEQTLKFKPISKPGLGPESLTPSLPPRACLEIREGEPPGKQFLIGSGLAVIGRREICDIRLQDPSISRRHAVITKSGGRYWIKDHDSTNGTYVNGVKIKQTELLPGDLIKMGKIVLGFKVE